MVCKLKISEYVGSQFGNPQGIFGKIACFFMNRINKIQYNLVLNEIINKDNMRVLDIGYGNGYLIKNIYNKCKCDINGIDISEDMKENARKRNKEGVLSNKINLEIGDVCNLHYEEESFDYVTSVNTIYFWNDIEKGLREIHGVLKEGGSFINAIYSKEWLESLAYTKQGFKLYETEEIAQKARQCGFSKVTIKEANNKKSYIIICEKSK